MSLCEFLEVLYFMKKTILLTFLLSSALLIMNVSAFAADVNSFSDLAAGGDLTFAQDIVVESATPSVTLPDGTVVDGAHHSLTGVQGTYLNIGSNTSTVTLKNIGDIQDGSSTDNTFSYQNAAGDTVYKKITNSFNGFHKTEWGQAPAQNKLLGTVNIDNSVFSNNVSDEDAGVFFASNALLTITNSTFYDNHAASNWYGGGVIQTLTNNSQLLTIDSSLFVNNTAGEGGALDTSVQTYISNSVFANNQAIGYDGGAIWYGMAAVSANYVNYLINSEFVNNTATRFGGALSLDGLNDGMNIINTSFRGNQAAYGGAIYAVKFRDGIPLSVVDSSFTNNTANEGAGIYSGNIDLNIFAVNKDVVFDGNTATNETASYNAGSDIYFDAGGNDATLFLNAASGKKIIFNGSIASYTDNTVASIDINKSGLTYSPDTGITTEMVSDASSQIQFNNRVGDDTYNFNINLYNGVLAIGQNPTINAGVDNPDGFIDGNNLHVMAESTLYTINNVIGSVNLKGLDLSSNLNIQADADLATSTMDTIHVDTVTGTEKIVLSGVNVLSDTTGDSTVVQFTDTNLADYVAVKDNLQAVSPVYKYTVANNGDGSLTFTRFNDNPDPDDPGNYNPTVFEPTIAVNTVSNVQDYINSLVFRDFSLFEHNDFKQQGKAAGDFLANEKIGKIYYSAVPRAFQSAELVAQQHSTKVELVEDPLVIDISWGVYEGKTYLEAFGDENGGDYMFHPEKLIIPEGETFYSVMNRLRLFFVKFWESDENECTIVSHGAITNILSLMFLHAPLEKFWSMYMSACGVSKVQMKSIYSFTIEYWNANHFLKEGEKKYIKK